jgi:hypothetical protein
MFGVFRVKNHDFTPKNHIFSNFREGARRVRPPTPWIRPWDIQHVVIRKVHIYTHTQKSCFQWHSRRFLLKIKQVYCKRIWTCACVGWAIPDGYV